MRISDWSSDVCSSDLARRYGRDQTIYDPWHYVPVLAKKPGALRNGAPFKQLALPPGLERLRSRLKESSDGDRQMVKILTAITVDGLDAVESAAAEALAGGVASADVVLNILARSRSAPVEPSIATPDHDRKSVGEGKAVAVRVETGGRGIIKTTQ